MRTADVALALKSLSRRRSSRCQMCAAASALFPPAPPPSKCVQDGLLSKEEELRCLALGLGRMTNVLPRQEISGPPVRCCVRLASGAYLRVHREGSQEWEVDAQGRMPGNSDCLFVARKGGVALHLRVTLQHAASGLYVTARPSCVTGAALAPAVTEDCRFRVDAAAMVAGALNVHSRGGLCMGIDSTGELSWRAPAGKRQLVWLLDADREQRRCDAYRQAVTQSIAPMTPPSMETQTQQTCAPAEPTSPGFKLLTEERARLTAASEARFKAEQAATVAYERVSAARARVADALAEQAAAEAAAASARATALEAAKTDMALSAALAQLHVTDTPEEDWVSVLPVSSPSGGLDR